MSKSRPSKPPVEPHEATRPAIVPPRKRPALLALATIALAGWLVFLAVMAFGT